MESLGSCTSIRACDGRLLEVPVDGQLERLALPRDDLQRQLFLGMGLDPPQQPAAGTLMVGGRRGDLAGARRRAGHFGPIGQADGDGDFLGRLLAGVLQNDLVAPLPCRPRSSAARSFPR